MTNKNKCDNCETIKTYKRLLDGISKAPDHDAPSCGHGCQFGPGVFHGGMQAGTGECTCTDRDKRLAVQYWYRVARRRALQLVTARELL